MLNEGEKCRKSTYSTKTESLVCMGQGFIFVFKLTLQSQKGF